MWQKRLDLVPDQVLCKECIEDKDDAHYAGKGLHWVPSPRCTLCHRIRTSLQAPMPEHAPLFLLQKLPALLSKRRRLLLKKRPIACPPSLFMARIQEYTLYTTDARGVDAEAAIPGQSLGMRVHTRRTVPSCPTRYPHRLPLWFAPSPSRHGRNGTDDRPRLFIGQELVAV